MGTERRKRPLTAPHRLKQWSGAQNVSDEAQSPAGGSDDPIIGRDFITAAVQAAVEKQPANEQDLIAGEPLLSAYLRDGTLQILGKLALAGAGPQLIENVAEDYFRLLNVAVNATRDAYRALLNDFLPENGINDRQSPPGDGSPTDRQS